MKKGIVAFWLIVFLGIDNNSSLCQGAWSIGSTTISYSYTIGSGGSCGFHTYTIGKFNYANGVWTQGFFHDCPGNPCACCEVGYDTGYPGTHSNWSTPPLPSCCCDPWNPTIQAITDHLDGSQMLLEAQTACLLITSGVMEFYLNTMYPDGDVDPAEFQFMMCLMLPEESLENNENLAEGADPISLSNSAYTYSSTDIVLPSRGLPIHIARNYNSKCEYNSRFGNGWDMNYNMKVRPLYTPNDPLTPEIDESQYIWDVMLLDGNGQRYEFSREDETVDELYHIGDRDQYIMLDKEDKQQIPTTHPYALVKKSGVCYYFNDNGNLVRIEDRNGNSITLTYDAEMSDVYGYSRHFDDDGTGEYDDKRSIILSDYKLTEIEDSIGNTLLFSYYETSEPDGDIGLLKTITDQRTSRTWTYKYDLQYNNLITLEKPEVDDPYNPGTPYSPTVTYHYDNPAFPQAITSIIDSEQQSTQTPYLENTYEHNPETLRSLVTEQVYGPTDSGQSSTYSVVYDNDGKRAIIGSREKVDYQSNPISKSLTITTYNDKGQTVSETVASNPSDDDPPIRAFTTTYEYNEFDQVSKVILPRRNCIEYQHDYLANNFNLDTMTAIQRPECDVLPFNGNPNPGTIDPDFITVSDSGTYEFADSSDDFTVALWVKRLRSGTAEILLDKRDDVSDGWVLEFNSSDQLVLSAGAVSATSTSLIDDTDWHYVVVSVDRNGTSAGVIDLYIDGGSAEDSEAITDVSMSITSDLYIGRCSYAASGYFQGSLDEVMILNRALSRDTVDNYSIFGLSEYSQGLIGYWKMATEDDQGTTITDYSVSNTNGVTASGRTVEDMIADGKVAGEIKIITTYIQNDSLDYVDTVTDPKGNVIEYTYDFELLETDPLYGTKGNLMKIEYPTADNYKWDSGLVADTQANEVTFIYNSYGQITEMTVPHPYNITLGYLKTKYEYYAFDYPTANTPAEYIGRLYRVIIDPDETGYDGANIVTEYTYDTQGNVNYTVLDSGELNIETSYVYDALDRLEKIIQPLNTDPQTDPYYIAEYQYNKNGKLWKANQKFLDGQSTPAQQTQTVEYGYNLLDNLKTVTDALGRIVENRYDDNENVAGIVDPEGRGGFPGTDPDYQTIYRYDERDLLSVTIDAEDNLTSPTHPTVYEYDKNGNLKSIEDGKGQVTTYTYDNFDRLIEIKYPDENPAQRPTETFEYDAVGNVIQKKNRAGDFFYYDYDALGRLIRKIIDDVGGDDVVIDDSPIAVSGTWGSSDVLGEYTNNCLVSESVSVNDKCQFQCTVNSSKAYYVYLWWPNGGSQSADDVTVTLNDTGNTSLSIDQTEHCAQWYQLGTGSYTFSSGTATIEFVVVNSSEKTYVDAVRLVPVDLSITKYVYDISGRILRIDENSNQTDYEYNALGRLDYVKDQGGKEVEYDYDNLGRRTRLDYPDNTCVTYEYDEMGRLVEVLYDDDITDQNDPVILAHYDYDELSRRTDLYYNYDGDGSYNETDVDGRTTYDYEDKVEDPQTNNNLGNRLEAIYHDIDNDGTDELTFEYTYDKVGNSLSKTINGGDPHNYDYDNIYQLTEDEDTQSGGDVYNWVYDDLGNWLELKLNTVTQTEFSTYDSTDTTENSLNQYSSVGLPSPGTRTDYSYDDNGNLEYDGTRTYTYDPENRLLSVEFGDTLCQYGYDAVGRRIWKKIWDTTPTLTLTSCTEYVYDGSQVVAEYEDSDLDGDADTLARKFIYGPGIDEPICMITYAGGDEDGRYFYHFDALGSVVALSQYNSGNGYASIVEQYQYSAFGETTVTQNGTTGNPYRFTGRQWDGETGLYYYRARMYSPALGRFLQPDPIGYADSMNLYAYVGNNPVGFVDPSGFCKDSGLGASLGGFFSQLGSRSLGLFNIPRHLRNLYNFGAMLDQFFYDFGADPGIVYDTLYDFGYHSNEIYLNDIANKTDRELGGMVGDAIFDLELAVIVNSALKNYGNVEIGPKPKPTPTYGSTPGGRPLTRHYAVEKGPKRRIPGSVVDDVINNTKGTPVSGGKTVYYDPANNVTVVTGDGSSIVSVHKGPPRKGQL